MEVSGLVKARIENFSVQFTEGPDEISVGYEYEDGHLTSVHYGDSVYVFTYDKWGNLLTVTMDGSTLVTYDYGTEAYKGLPQTIAYGSSKIYYTYDHLDRVSTVGYTKNNPRYEYSYSADGNLTTVYNKSENLTTKYTENGYQIYRGTPASVTEILYEYNNGEENYSESVLGQSLTYTVETDESFSWLKAADEAGILVYSEKTEYDVFDRLEEKTLNVGSLEVSQSYDYIVKDNTTGNRVSDYTIRYNHGESAQNISFSYTYDGNGNITSVEELCNGTSYRTEYTYDEAGQLKTVFDEKTGAQYGYYYDEYGNIVYEELYYIDSNGKKVLEDWVVYTYEGMELVRSNSYANGVTNYVTSANCMIIQMSESATSIALAWGDGRCLREIRDYNNNWAAGYTYNEQGLRIGKRISGEGIVTKEWEYVWGQNGLAGFTQGENTVVVHYGQDGTPVGFSLNDTVYTYIKNIQGDILRILDTTGNTVVEYSYDPWGVPTVTGDAELAAINPCSYRGYDYDEESGFYYLQSRYYDPENGRFIIADVMLDTATILGFNVFSYCGNNPIMYVDPEGYGRTYVIYYNNSGSGFYEQAMNSPYYNRKSKNVYMISVISKKDFIKAWNSMSGTIDYVYLYLHGGKGVLYFKGENLSFSGNQSFSSLNSKKVNKGVYLFSCKGGAGSEGNNVAWMFAKLTDSKVYACTGSVSYSKISGKYYARKALDLGIIKTFYYQKRYIYWGAIVAKSIPGQW